MAASSNPTPQRVFISYSHDSQEHMDRVWDLSEKLRGDGVDCRIDQHEEAPPEGWPQWCSNQVEESEFVLIACTETYQRRYEGKEEPGKGLGARWEGFVITQELYEAHGKNTKFVPVVFSPGDGGHIPIVLRATTRYDLTTPDGYEKLFRRVSGQPARRPSPVAGTVRTMPTAVPVQTAPAAEPLPTMPTMERKSPSPEPSIPKKQLFTLPFRENRIFTGRGDVLEGLKTSLEANGVAALTGLSGVGKTQTAVRYAYEHRREYDAVLWLRAESQETLFADLAQLAVLLQLPERDAKEQSVIVEAMKRWLHENDGWLLVLDNVIDLQSVGDFTDLASANGRHIIVTTQADATGWIEGQKLRPMNEEVGASLLLRRAKIIAAKQHALDAKANDADLARKISAKVGGLPLALAQAGAYIEKTKCGLGGYLELLTERFAAMMNELGGTDLEHKPVFATLSLSLDNLAQTNEAALEMLKAAAFLPPDAIPEEIFTEGAKEFAVALRDAALDPLAWNNAIGAALGFSLLERNQDEKTIAVHRTVQEVVKSHMSAEERAQWAEQVVRAVNAAFTSPEFEFWGKCERLTPSAQACAALVDEYQVSSAEAARLLNEAGYYLKERARYAEAEPLYRKSLAICEQAYGPDHSEVAIRLNNLATLLQATNRLGEAEPLYRRALAIDEKSLGPEHPNVAIRLNNLAVLLKTTNRLGEAEPLHRRSLEISEKALGQDHPAVATRLNNLAQLLQASNRLAEAEPFYRRALAIDERAYGPDHPDVAIDLNNLAVLLQDTNRLREAEPFYRRALAIWEKALGLEHPQVAFGLNNLAQLLQATNRLGEAESLTRRAVAIGEHSYGPDHPELAVWLNNLARLLQDTNRLAEAEPLLRRALDTFQNSLGPEHPSATTVRKNLAVLLRQMGKNEEAEKL